MSKRLQVLFDEAELDQLRETAMRHGLPVSEWVRQTLREAQRRQSGPGVDVKLAAVREAVKHEFPSGDIDQMLAEIERGYLGE
ncbi:MAG: antitoxin [Actinobacteria bacterium]|nr:antitoxin [Actinomycetota bacterium]